MRPGEKRREARYRARLPLRLVRGRDVVQLQTEDVSFRGVFLRMDSPPALRQLLRLEVTLPAGATIRVHAMVVYRVDAGGAQTPGAGMQFYGLEGRERAQWEAFVHEVRDGALVLSPSSHDPVRRKFERFDVRFEVRLASVDELAQLFTRDISRGGMALETELDLAIGTEVGIELVHPENGEMFELDAVVRRQIRTAEAKGLAVEFTGMDDARREALTRFIGDALPKVSAVTVKEGDPKLA